MILSDKDGRPREVSLTVERRGISRQRVCDFPPIRLRLDKTSAVDTPFEGEGALKLVTHCDDGDRWTQYYVLEMLAYRFYNLITDYSFKVRPMNVRYRDIDRDRVSDEEFAFVIEDVDDLAKRHDMVEIEPGRIYPGHLDPERATFVALFQFMIGNLDWSALSGPGGECCHNVKLIGSPDATTYVPVPYDFDATGLVDAHYAAPPDGLPVRSVRSRLYRGFCAHNGALPKVRRRFIDHQLQILSLVREEPRLTERNRHDALNYLEEFFEIVRDDGRFNDDVLSKCRG
ncbi:MAG: hypothetical protein R3212_09510 [Xanthomonadales bacterium]|nr:hypothetical protein [Xanthomonadales bacterium]